MTQVATPGVQFQKNRMMIGTAIGDVARAMNFLCIAADNCVMVDHITTDEHRQYLATRSAINDAMRDLCNLAVKIHGAATDQK